MPLQGFSNECICLDNLYSLANLSNQQLGDGVCHIARLIHIQVTNQGKAIQGLDQHDCGFACPFVASLTCKILVHVGRRKYDIECRELIPEWLRLKSETMRIWADMT